MVRAVAVVMVVGGAIALLLGFVSGAASLFALLERRRGGPGIMFADVEFFGLLALVCSTIGIFSLLVAKRLGRHLSRKETEGKR
ncbi:MAG TPA: hypothetical protein VK654_17030 [Nitrospirota bacterium]|nr:hypothetical protein [Nitrospirota bacterium]